MRFSDKQLKALLWWKNSRYDGIICDGAVRSGKTLSMGLGFISWAMASFENTDFALCGKTITSVKRNVLSAIKGQISSVGMVVDEKVSKNYFDVFLGERKNRFWFFGGKDESSASLIQGMTLGGVFFDEVALMPRSFVEQAVARCSLKNSKMWFNCNPEGPYHWFYREWIKKAKEKNLLYLHFEMSDNPSLSQRVLKRYETLYSGTFYKRFVLGEWVTASGLIYPMFSEKHIKEPDGKCERYVVSADYGTVNPTSIGLWGLYDGKWFRLREYYYASKETGQQRTDEEHYAALEKLCMGVSPDFIIVDPSAASFMECIRRHGKFKVKAADNNVLNGIRRVANALSEGKIFFSPSCTSAIKEFHLYCWDEKSGGDTPLKTNDHAMDDIRYFVNAVIKNSGGDDGFFVASLSRN